MNSNVSLYNNLNGDGDPPKWYPNYSKTQSGYRQSFIFAEGLGFQGGFYYSMHTKITYDYLGTPYIYVSASAYSPNAEKTAIDVTYFCTVSVYQNESLIREGPLPQPDMNTPRIGIEKFTYIGSGYLELPTDSNNVSVMITISYRRLDENGYAFPESPYIFTIKF
jgi:hypothetical protein